MKKFFTFISISLCMAFASLTFTQPVFAAGSCSKVDKSFQQAQLGELLPAFPKYCDGAEVLRKVVNWSLGLLTTLATLIIVYAGAKWMLARDNETEVKNARQIINYAVMGLIVIMLSATIVNVTTNVLLYKSVTGK